MKSFRKKYKPEKQMYHLNRFSYSLNIWVYECASIIHNEIAVKEGNGIPRVCNWKVVGAKPKFEMFMENIFTENDYSNVQPTQEEIRSLDLPNNSHVPPTQPATSDVNHEEVQPDEQLLRRSTRISTIGSTPPPKRREVGHPTKNIVPKATQPDEQPNQPFQTPNSQPSQIYNVYGVPHNTIFRRTISDNAGLEELKGHMKSYVDKKIGALEALIIKNHSELMKAVGAKDNKSDKAVFLFFSFPLQFLVILIFWIMKDNGGISVPHIVDDSVDKGNVDPQSASDQFFQQSISPIQINFSTVDHDVDASAVENDETSIKEHAMRDSTDVIPTAHHSHVPVEEIVHNKEVDSITSKLLPFHQSEAVIDHDCLHNFQTSQLMSLLGVIISLQLAGSDDFLSMMATRNFGRGLEHNLYTKTLAPHNRMPSKILQSPYVNTFGSINKGK
ncbi:hypothetical protein H5410_002683, partial [Solanum commersonii]